jgi:hypothetical protein
VLVCAEATTATRCSASVSAARSTTTVTSRGVRQQRAVVRERALDEPRGQRAVPEEERDLTRPRARRDRPADLTGSTRDLLEGTDRDDRLTLDRVLERERPGREPVRVGRRSDEAAVPRLEVHPGQHGASVVTDGCCTSDLADEPRERVRLDRAAWGASLVDRWHRREIVGLEPTDAELRPSRT